MYCILMKNKMLIFGDIFMKRLLIVQAVFMLVSVCGCANKNSNIKSNIGSAGGEKPGDFLDVLSTQPASPAVLDAGQKVTVEIGYEIGSAENVMIWARPYFKGALAKGYSAHHLIPRARADAQSGVAEGYFFYESPAEVDEIRVMMRDVKSQKMLKEASYKAAFRWEGNIAKDPNALSRQSQGRSSTMRACGKKASEGVNVPKRCGFIEDSKMVQGCILTP